MIDTDKYEGHTPAPWSIKTGNAGHSVKDANGDHVCTIPDPTGMSNKHIIADAPLLLAEVKDLQKKLDNLREYCHAEGHDIFNWEVKNIEVIE